MKQHGTLLVIAIILATAFLVADGAAAVNSVTQTSYVVSQNAGTVTINFGIGTDVPQGGTIAITFEDFKTISGTPAATLTGAATAYTATHSGTAGNTLTYTVTALDTHGMRAVNGPYTLTITGDSDIVNPILASNTVTYTLVTSVPETFTKDITITPVVTSISPANRGAGSATTSYTITGDGFRNGGVAAGGVTIGGKASTGVTYNSQTSITATGVDVSALGAGTKNVVVINDGATGTGTNIFTINAAPTFTSAATDTAGNKITITFSSTMADPASKQDEFKYHIGGGAAQSFSAAALNADTTKIDLTPSGTAIANGNVVTIDYTVGTVTAADTGVLATFAGKAVTNNVAVPAPTFTSAATNTAGTTITITFSKAMANPAGKQGEFKYHIGGGAAQSFSVAALNADTTKIDLTPSGTAIANGDVVTIDYTVGTVTAADTGVLATFAGRQVTNNMPSTTAPTFTSAATNTAGTTITITFSKAMADPAGKQGEFKYHIGGGAAQSFSAAALNADTTKIDLTPSGTAIANGDVVTIDYTSGTVAAADTTVLATFTGNAVTNNKAAPPAPPSSDSDSGSGSAPAATGATSTTQVNVGGNSAVTQVTVTGTGISGVIVTSTVVSGPGVDNAPPSGNVFAYMEITPARATTITEAVISFTVPLSWLEENHLAPQNVIMNHQVGKTWNVLPTTLVKIENGQAYYTAKSPGFSRFAITGQINTSTNTTETTPVSNVQTFGDLAAADITSVESAIPDTTVPVTQVPAELMTTTPFAKSELSVLSVVFGILGAVVLVAGAGMIRRRCKK